VEGGDGFAAAVKSQSRTGKCYPCHCGSCFSDCYVLFPWLAGDGRTGAAEFELPDYWDDGEPLTQRDSLPVCVTYNLV